VTLAVLLGASVLTGIGTFGSGDALRDDLQEFAILAVFLAVVTAGVFWLVVRRALGPGFERENVALTGLIAGVIGFLSGAVLWSGLSVILGGAAGMLGYEGWTRAGASSGRRTLVLVALALGVLAIAGNVIVLIGDQINGG
jgi:hypothetical protein